MEKNKLELNNLDALLEGLNSNLITSQLSEITSATNAKKPKIIAESIIRAKHKRLDNRITKDILHDGVIHKVKYFDIEPLMRGQWSIISLMILNLTYSEQCTIIETIYPKELQLIAKAFAINFTANTETTVFVENDKEIIEKLDAINTGIATILVILQNLGGRTTHIDSIKNQMKNLEQMQNELKDVNKFRNQSNRASATNRFRDRL